MKVALRKPAFIILLALFLPVCLFAKDYDGIDISHHNKKINWKTVAKDKQIQFVYIKATEGATHKDKRYKTNFKQAQKAGLKVGSYHFFTMTSSTRNQFNHFKRIVDKNKQDLIPVIDVEAVTYTKQIKRRTKRGWRTRTVTREYSPKAVRDSVDKFARMVEKHYGVKPIIYTSPRIYNNFLGRKFTRYELFLAKYDDERPRIVGPSVYMMWQYSERGKIKGINHDTDLIRFHPQHSLKDILYTPKKRSKKK